MTSLIERMRRLILRPSQSEPAHPFDREHGVDTSGLYYADRLPSGHAHDRHSEGYYATAPSLFHGAMSLWMSSLEAGAEVEEYAFIDLGSGKGRVVLMASGYPFRAVRGIELSGAMHKVARRNLRRWKRAGRAVCRDVEVRRGDVLEVEIPAEPVVLFLFNSFTDKVLGPLMGRIGERRGPVDLIYVHPDHDRLVAGTPGIELVRYAEIPFSYEDVVADVFGVSSDVCSVYRWGAKRA